MAMVTAEWVLCLQQRSTSDRISMPVSAQVPPSCRRHNLIARVPPLLVDQSIEQDERHNLTCFLGRIHTLSARKLANSGYKSIKV